MFGAKGRFAARLPARVGLMAPSREQGSIYQIGSISYSYVGSIFPYSLLAPRPHFEEVKICKASGFEKVKVSEHHHIMFSWLP